MGVGWPWLALFVSATAAAAFITGVCYQQENATRQIHQLMQHDPYVLYVSPKIFEALQFFGYHTETTNERNDCLIDIMKFGFPGMADIHLYADFVLSYDRRNRVAHWVCEHLRAESLQAAVAAGDVRRSRAIFKSDLGIPSNFRSTPDDYRLSGYDRGHLAAAANHRAHQTHCNETFYLTNIAPQIGKGFNRNAWNKLEIYVRELTLRYDSVYVCTGPLYKPKQQENDKWSVEFEMIGSNMVAVPTHFFKVIIVESKLPLGRPYMEAYVLPNAAIPDATSLREFLCDIREIEHYAGLQFFNGLRRSQIFGSNYPSESQVFRQFN